MNPLFRWMLRKLQRTCKHDPSRVTADVLEGEFPKRQVQWCRDCGAYRCVTVFTDGMMARHDWRVPWLTCLLFAFLCSAAHAENLKLDARSFQLTLNEKSEIQALTFAGKPVSFTKWNTVQAVAIPSGVEVIDGVHHWKAARKIAIKYTARRGYILCEADSAQALWTDWYFAFFTGYSGKYTALKCPQAIQVDEDLFVGVLPLDIETDVIPTDDGKGFVVRSCPLIPAGKRRFAFYVCRGADLRTLPARIEAQCAELQMWKLKGEDAGRLSYLFITPNAGNKEQFWPTAEQIIKWCDDAGIRRVIILNGMIFDYSNSETPYKTTRWVQTVVPALKARGFYVQAHIGTFLPKSNALRLTYPDKYKTGFGDIEVDDAGLYFTDDVPTAQIQGHFCGKRLAELGFDGLCQDQQAGQYQSRVFTREVVRNLPGLKWFNSGGFIPHWESTTAPYDMHLEGAGGRDPLPVYLEKTASAARTQSLICPTDFGWYQRYSLPTSQYGSRPATKEQNEFYFAQCRKYHVSVGIKISWEQMQKAREDGTLEMIREVTDPSKEVQALIRDCLSGRADGRDIQAFINGRLR